MIANLRPALATYRVFPPFLLAYVHCTGGIHCDCDNSGQFYIIYWLGDPTIPPPPT
jgi:hypothetical protein